MREIKGEGDRMEKGGKNRRQKDREGEEWKERRNGEREKKNGGKGKRGILCSWDFSLGKTMLDVTHYLQQNETIHVLFC